VFKEIQKLIRQQEELNCINIIIRVKYSIQRVVKEGESEEHTQRLTDRRCAWTRPSARPGACGDDLAQAPPEINLLRRDDGIKSIL